MNVPDAVGVPLMVNTPPLNEPETPLGNPLTVPPVALPPIAYVILVMATFWQTVWFVVDAAEVRAIVPL